MDYKAIMKKARETNRKRDEIDGNPLIDLPAGIVINTAMTAIEVGIRTDEWDFVAEALAALEDLREKFTQSDYEGKTQ